MPKTGIKPKYSKDFPNGGYCYLEDQEVEIYLNYPSFNFRPSQCDSLHLDLWINGNNIFRDGGTFSYNAGDKYIDYYGGARSHNTVQFDEHEQMPRLSRFLLGDWLRIEDKETVVVNDSVKRFSVSYKDRFQCRHKRSLALSQGKLTILDCVSGFKNKAVSRFRLIPANWVLVDNKLTSEHCSIIINADVDITRLELINGKESRYYYQESEIQVLEIEITNAGTITTEVLF